MCVSRLLGGMFNCLWASLKFTLCASLLFRLPAYPRLVLIFSLDALGLIEVWFINSLGLFLIFLWVAKIDVLYPFMYWFKLLLFGLSCMFPNCFKDVLTDLSKDAKSEGTRFWAWSRQSFTPLESKLLIQLAINIALWSI